MTTQKKSIIAAGLIAFLAGMACKPKTPPNPNNEELITSVVLHFSDSAGLEPDRTYIYRDLDGDGGAAPERFDTIRLTANKTYWTTLYFLDENKTPIDTISNEVKAEAGEHLICYTPMGMVLPISLLDKDAANLPLGLESKWYVGAATQASLRLQLRHQPGTKNGSCEPGSSDVDLSFNCSIQ